MTLPWSIGMTTPDRERRRTGGFTLIEVVVAVAIAGLALVALFRAGTGGLIAVDAAGRVDEAIERAQSHLAAFGRSGAIVPGESRARMAAAIAFRCVLFRWQRSNPCWAGRMPRPPPSMMSRC